MEIFSLLNKRDFIVSWELLKFQQFEGGFFYKVKAHISNNTELYAKDRIEYEERDYSFHWQDKEGKLIVRWDNRPHFKQLKSFPHHMHLPNQVEESYSISLEEVLDFIGNTLQLPVFDS